MRGIYKIVNSQNGKIYVGSSLDVERRWRKHKSALRAGRHRNPHLQNSWDLYGESAFSLSVLEQVSEDLCLLEAEQRYIDTLKPDYNIATHATGGSGPRSEETKQKISAAVKGDKHPFFGKTHSEETRKKISEANLGKAAWNKGTPLSKAHRAKLSESLSGSKHPQFGVERAKETKKKISASLTGHEVSAETRKKISEALTGKQVPDAVREKISKANSAENNGSAKLDWEKVREIRRLYDEGETQVKIRKMFDVSKSAVYNIVKHISWKDDPATGKQTTKQKEEQ